MASSCIGNDTKPLIFRGRSSNSWTAGQFWRFGGGDICNVFQRASLSFLLFFAGGMGCGWRDSREIKPTPTFSWEDERLEQMVLVVRYRSPEDAAEGWLLRFHIRYGFPWTPNSSLFEWLDRVFRSWKLWSIDQVNDFWWSTRCPVFQSIWLRQWWSNLNVWKPKRLGLGVWVRASFWDHMSWEAYQSWSKLWWNQHGHQQTPLQSFR